MKCRCSLRVRNNVRAFCRAIFFVSGLMITIVNINLNLQIYLKLMTKTEMTIERDAQALLPCVTICLNSMHSRGNVLSNYQNCYLKYLERLAATVDYGVFRLTIIVTNKN